MQNSNPNIMPYQFDIDDDTAQRIGFSPDHPLSKNVQAWANKQGLSQEAFNELISFYVANIMDDIMKMEENDYNELARLDEYFGDAQQSEHARKDVARWLGGLLQDQLEKEPEIEETLANFASTANGMKILHALKNKIGERAIPNNSAGQQIPTLTKEKLLQKMNSDAYFNPAHPQYENLHREIRRGFQQLYK